MSFFDRVTKAVSDTVDKGKKEVDQFMRIQKVKGEISKAEEAIRAAGARAQQVKQEIGDAVIARLKEGTLSDPALQGMADRVAAIDGEVAGHNGVIAEKRAEIARIESEDAAPVVPAAAPSAPPPSIPSAEAAPPPAAVGVPVPPPLPSADAAPPPLPGAATKLCPSCSAHIPVNATFCTACGAKLG